VNRNRGKFAPKAEAEPARTERLLARPFSMWHTSGQDAMASMMLWLKAASEGSGIFFAFTLLGLQVSLAFLKGFAVGASATSYRAHLQALGLVVVQFCLGTFCYFMRAGQDKVGEVVNGSSYLIEACMLALLYTQYFVPDDLSVLSFLLALGGAGVPFFQLLYDQLIVPLFGVVGFYRKHGILRGTLHLIKILRKVPVMIAEKYLGIKLPSLPSIPFLASLQSRLQHLLNKLPIAALIMKFRAKMKVDVGGGKNSKVKKQLLKIIAAIGIFKWIKMRIRRCLRIDHIKKKFKDTARATAGKCQACARASFRKMRGAFRSRQ